MGKDKYDAEGTDGTHSSDAGVEIEASSPEEAREIGDKILDDYNDDTTPGFADVTAVTNERTGEETRFD